MKHNSTRSLIVHLTTGMLFGTAWTVAAIDFTPPKIPGSLKTTQKSVEKASAASASSSNPCKRWDVSGKWELRLDDGGSVQVNLQQGEWQGQSANLTGTGERIAPPPNAPHAYYFNKSMKGVISGNITYNSFTILLKIRTDEHRFTGTISPSGKMEGSDTSGSRRDHWVSSSRMTCADQPASSGTPQEPVTTAPAPKISASSRVVSIPDGQSKGAVTLTWDGGPDHPYAEVWVQVDGGDEKFVVEQGKGTRSVTVERGKNYLFILTDAGQQLATVAVSSK